VTTLAILAVSVAAGLLSSRAGGAPVNFVDHISSAIDAVADGAGSRVWWTYAFLLGAVAAFNPCGFALLPAYLGLYLSEKRNVQGVAIRGRHALLVSLVVAGSFTALFGAIGAVFELGSSLIVRWLPWVGLGVGVILIVVGGVFLAGGHVGANLPERLAGGLGPSAAEPGLRGYGAFGLAYGLASLGCALPLFLALLGTAVEAGGRGSAVVAFALYGLGMATVLGGLTVAAAVVSSGIFARVRVAVRYVSGLSAVLLLASGAYVVYYWLSVGRVLLG
jgi:cytochrome c-type biogenesis protein